MAKASNVVAVARREIGVCEKPANSNKQKYGKWFGSNGVFWCAIYVVWCFHHAGADNLIKKNSSAATCQDLIVSKCGGTWIMPRNGSETKYKKRDVCQNMRKAYLKAGKPGDVVTFDFGKYTGWRDHIGIVDHIEGDYVYCLEGNTSQSGSQSNGGMVCLQRRIYTSICAAARPAFEPESQSDQGKYYTGQFPTLPKRGWFKRGDKSNQVKLLQHLLNWAVGTRLETDGEYGPKTAQAVYAFEAIYGLTQDGEFGKKCLKKAKEIRK